MIPIPLSPEMPKPLVELVGTKNCWWWRLNVPSSPALSKGGEHSVVTNLRIVGTSFLGDTSSNCLKEDKKVFFEPCFINTLQKERSQILSSSLFYRFSNHQVFCISLVDNSVILTYTNKQHTTEQ